MPIFEFLRCRYAFHAPLDGIKRCRHGEESHCLRCYFFSPSIYFQSSDSARKDAISRRHVRDEDAYAEICARCRQS